MLLVQGQGLQIKLAALGNSQGIALKCTAAIFLFSYTMYCVTLLACLEHQG